MAKSSLPIWLACWALAVASGIVFRPPLPVDETRYLAVAWEMWYRGDFIVPYLNGEPYHHKPPLLFWLMTAGWSVFGVNEWWPRLVAPLFALATLWGSVRLATLLWPDDTNTPQLAPLLLVGTAFWSIFQTLTMFDMMLAAFTIAGIVGVVTAWRKGGWSGWLLVAFAIGLGVLAKGPAILLHILPVALLAPWWGPKLPSGPDQPLISWKQWYFRLFIAFLIGAAIALAWAIPAGINGGEEYRNMIFWGQSAGRIVKSFDHARPFWWYLAVIPPLLLPWLLWPQLWRTLRSALDFSDGAFRLLIAWVIPAVFVFSLISGKQLHYLLPEFAAFALLFARGLSAHTEAAVSKFGRAMLASFFAILCMLLLAFPHFSDLLSNPQRFELLAPYWGGALSIMVLLIWFLGGRSVASAIKVVAVSMAGLILVTHLVAKEKLDKTYDLRPIAAALKEYEDQGYALANFGNYHGQYQFMGRLKTPMAQLGLDFDETNAYIDATPKGVVVAYYYRNRMPDFPDDATPLAEFRFRDFNVKFWSIDLLRKYRNLGNRS